MPALCRQLLFRRTSRSHNCRSLLTHRCRRTLLGLCGRRCCWRKLSRQVPSHQPCCQRYRQLYKRYRRHRHRRHRHRHRRRCKQWWRRGKFRRRCQLDHRRKQHRRTRSPQRKTWWCPHWSMRFQRTSRRPRCTCRRMLTHRCRRNQC